MKHLVIGGDLLTLTYQEPGTREPRVAITGSGAVVPEEVPADVLAPLVASGRLRQVADEDVAHLPVPTPFCVTAQRVVLVLSA